ncbi:MAG: hypothetical protein AAGI90_00315 [Chlamydiota bacterium]
MHVFFLFFLICLRSLSAGTVSMGATTLELFDEERNHPVVVEIWYPTDPQEPAVLTTEEQEHWKYVWIYPQEVREAPISSAKESYPLLMMSHGNCGCRLEQSWFAEEMVKRGYIVASVDHFGNTCFENDRTYICRSWERPMDVRFALDALLDSPIFREKIDIDRMGFCGYSLGGMTGLFLAGGLVKDVKQELSAISLGNVPKFLVDKVLESVDWDKTLASFKDDRIKSYFLLAPAASIFSPDSLENISAPVHIVYTLGDRTLPPESHAIYVKEKIQHADLTLVDDKAGHFVFLNEVSDSGKKVLPKWIYEEDPSVDRRKIFSAVANEAEEFFTKTLATR